MMNLTMTFSHIDGFGMPISSSGRILSVRALPTTGVVCAAAGSKSVVVDAVDVRGYGQVTELAVPKGAFPGTSAWSPPI
ncbi:MAG: hypothetical protein ACXVXC_13325 [Nocardioidaceae bacterium]